MGNALATWFEARRCVAGSARNMRGGAWTARALVLSELCYRTLLADGATPLAAVSSRVVTPALERLSSKQIRCYLRLEPRGCRPLWLRTGDNHCEINSLARGLELDVGLNVQIQRARNLLAVGREGNVTLDSELLRAAEYVAPFPVKQDRSVGGLRF